MDLGEQRPTSQADHERNLQDIALINKEGASGGTLPSTGLLLLQCRQCGKEGQYYLEQHCCSAHAAGVQYDLLQYGDSLTALLQDHKAEVRLYSGTARLPVCPSLLHGF